MSEKSVRFDFAKVLPQKTGLISMILLPGYSYGRAAMAWFDKCFTCLF